MKHRYDYICSILLSNDLLSADIAACLSAVQPKPDAQIYHQWSLCQSIYCKIHSLKCSFNSSQIVRRWEENSYCSPTEWLEKDSRTSAQFLVGHHEEWPIISYLDLKDATKLARNRPLWRLLEASRAMHWNSASRRMIIKNNKIAKHNEQRQHNTLLQQLARHHRQVKKVKKKQKQDLTLRYNFLPSSIFTKQFKLVQAKTGR